MPDEKRMIENFEIIHSLQIGAREVVVGVSPEQEFMCCFCTQDGMNEYYAEAMASDDYLEIMDEAGQYSDAEIDRRMGTVIRANLEYRLSKLQGAPIEDYLRPDDYQDSQGRRNTYIAYLRALNRFHSLPVVITEYGVTTGRGMAQRDVNTGRNQGHMSEQEHGQALVDCYRDIMDAGCAGSCVFTWQDEWFKRTWNTMHAVDLNSTAYWSDYSSFDSFMCAHLV